MRSFSAEISNQPPPTRPEAGAFLVSHGNGGNLSYRGGMAAALNETTGAGVFLYDYPGYGHSEGSPTEAGCYAAADAAYAWLTDLGRTPPRSGPSPTSTGASRS